MDLDKGKRREKSTEVQKRYQKDRGKEKAGYREAIEGHGEGGFSRERVYFDNY